MTKKDSKKATKKVATPSVPPLASYRMGLCEVTAYRSSGQAASEAKALFASEARAVEYAKSLLAERVIVKVILVDLTGARLVIEPQAA